MTPTSRVAIDPAVLVDFLKSWSHYSVGGRPHRERLYINGTRIEENDARMIRRWRAGSIRGVTVKSARALLGRYGLTLDMLAVYAQQHDASPTTRGALPQTKEKST